MTGGSGNGGFEQELAPFSTHDDSAIALGCRCAADVVHDAEKYVHLAGQDRVTYDDVMLAVQSMQVQLQGQIPTPDDLLGLARQKNIMPLPKPLAEVTRTSAWRLSRTIACGRPLTASRQHLAGDDEPPRVREDANDAPAELSCCGHRAGGREELNRAVAPSICFWH